MRPFKVPFRRLAASAAAATVGFVIGGYGIALAATTISSTSITADALNVGSTNVLSVSSGGVLTLPVGSATGPALAWVGDSDTGLFSSGADTLNLSTGGSERMRISSTGSVGIGTNAPGAPLEVKNTSAANSQILWLTKTQTGGGGAADQGGYLLFAGGSAGSTTRGYFGFTQASGGTTTILSGAANDAIALRAEGALIFGTGGDNIRMTVSSAGLVGIGTTSPAARLHVEDSTNSNAALEELTVRRSRADATAPGAADFGSDLTYRLEGFTDNSDVLAVRARGAWEAAQSNDTTDRDSYLAFSTMANNTLAERMRISSSGNVGIGLTNPGAPLEVNSQIKISSALAQTSLLITGSAADVGVSLTNTGTSGREYQLLSSSTGGGFSAGSFTIYDVTTGGGAPGARLTISSTGNVGIGTTTPQSSLHVPDGKYAQFEDNNAGAPAAGDCDADAERGRLSIDTTNNRLYVCNGTTRGWDYAALTD